MSTRRSARLAIASARSPHAQVKADPAASSLVAGVQIKLEPSPRTATPAPTCWLAEAAASGGPRKIKQEPGSSSSAASGVRTLPSGKVSKNDATRRVKVEPGIGAAAAHVKSEKGSFPAVPPRPAWAVFDEGPGQDDEEEPYPKFAQPVWAVLDGNPTDIE